MEGGIPGASTTRHNTGVLPLIEQVAHLPTLFTPPPLRPSDTLRFAPPRSKPTLLGAPPSSLGSSSCCEGGAGKQGLGYPSLKVSCPDRAASLSPRSYRPRAPRLVARQPEGLRGYGTF